MRIAFGLALGLTLTTAPVLAAPPVLNGVSPRGFQRGQTATLTLSGNGVGLSSPQILSTLPGTLGPVKIEEPE